MKPPILTTPPPRESRFLSASVELRSTAERNDEKTTVFGYAAKFNSRSDNLGGQNYQFYEILSPGAFDDVLKDDVRALLNHESSAILARSKGGVGSLKIGADATGLWYEFEAPDTQIGRDLLTSLKRGDIDQSSFSFTVASDGYTWAETGGGEEPTVYTRTITKISRLYDVSPVTYPAYPDATVALRSLEEFRQEPEPPAPTEDHSIAHRQRALGLLDKTATA